MADKSAKAGSEAKVDPEKKMDDEYAQGFRGVEVDPTPNEEYSLESDSWKVPEADPDAEAKAYSGRGSRFKNRSES